MIVETRVMNSQPGPLDPSMIPLQSAAEAMCAFYSVQGAQGGANTISGEEQCTAQNDLRCLSTQILAMQERERQRIATDLHDGLGQSLTLIKLGLEECSALLDENELDEVVASLRQLRLKVQNTFGELRRVAMDLRPSILDDLGILATLSWFFRDFENACHSIKVEKYLLVQESNITALIKVAIFRILQEAVCNIVKHAKADQIRVSLNKHGKLLHFTIEDNGQGFDPAEVSNYCPLNKGLGLVSMKERAINSGGTFRIDSAIGQGTRITVYWPCE